MAKAKPSFAAGTYTVQGGCAICHLNPAGPSGMCAACAGGLAGPGLLQNHAIVIAGPASVATHFPRQQPDPLPRADMQVVDLVGWRVWRITATGYLRSLTAPTIWLPDQPMEAERVEDHGVGANGIHVFLDRRGAVLEVETYLAHAGDQSYAIGSVLLWGDVVEHERGYRAERAKILSVDDVTWRGKPPWNKETAEVLGFLRARYGVAGHVPRGTEKGED